MTGAPFPSAIPPPRDDDDDDVAWALQTAQVQWKRGAQADAVVWLRRAAESAISIGAFDRSVELNRAAGELEHLLGQAAVEEAAGAARGDRFSAPLPSIPIDVEVELDGVPRGPEGDTERSLQTVPPATPPPSVLNPRTGTTQQGLPPAGAGLPVMRPPPPRRPPPPPRPVFHSEPSFVTSAPSIDEMLKQPRNTSEALAPSPAPASSNTPVPWSVEPEEVSEEDLSSSAPPASGSFEHATLVAPPPHEDLPSGYHPQTIAAEAEPGLDRPSSRAPERAGEGSAPAAPREHRDSDLTLSDDDFPPSSNERTLSEPLERGPSQPAAGSGTERPITGDSAGEALIADIPLSSVQGLQDLPDEAQQALVESARLQTLAVEEEISSFGVALVIEGWVTIMPTIADAACAHATKGAVVFTAGTLSDFIALRVVAGQDDTVVSIWDTDDLERATQDCPWVGDELRIIADRFQALAGVTMGAMGDRLDDSLRSLVTDRCEVKTLLPYEVLVERDSPLPGLHIIGGGRVEIIVESPDGGGEVEDELGPGDFLFAPQVLGAGKAPATARAGKGGALVLFADRMTTHELLVSVPPLLELLAG
jgi:hypothetical protein